MKNPHLLTGIQYDVVTSQLPAGIVTDHDVRIPMRDGVHLAASLYRPATPGTYPVIMAITPYGKSNFETISGFSSVPNNHIGHIRLSDSVSFESADPGYWVPHGYVVIMVDVRGQGASEGDTDLMSPTEQDDYQELIAWASSQPWSNGKVGLHGVSYLAITQWAVAQHRPSALRAIVPWEAFTDHYLRAYPGGIPEVGMWRFVFEDIILPNHNSASGFVVAPEGMTPADHPLRDEFWIAQRFAVEKVEIPVLLCASFSDQGLHTRESFENFNLISSTRKWLYSHRQPKWQAYYGAEALSYQLAFFDRFLKGVDNGFEATAPVRLEINLDRNRYKVITGQAWPLPQTQYQTLYLSAASAKLSEVIPLDESASEYESTIGLASFDFRFDAETDVVGNAKLKLWVESIGSDDMDLFVGIKKIDTAGHEVYFYGFGGTNPNDVVARGWLRVSHRELDTRASRPDRPVHTHSKCQKLQSGEIVPIEIEILPSGTTFLPGEILRVVVQGRAIEPDAVLLTFLPSNRGAHRIWTGGKYDSHLLLPVLPPDEAA
ncbi:putative acyl esterase [Bradyrhizobium sp. USDA 3397]